MAEDVLIGKLEKNPVDDTPWTLEIVSDAGIDTENQAAGLKYAFTQEYPVSTLGRPLRH
ncbi:hypothetical protein AG0111_0g1711 [Alternaria gaisen]|uniref:Uncharacterized protein n=1 Tax=Alternaria gaisen TaxID=167740 RepID=A0ACB6FZ08_9PLEO|nr:hypothetical protein AG0111_0g1711 [Alternaria gaisen]